MREHISQSAVALAIGELEQALGVQLFLRRRAKGLTITPAGLAVLADARPLLAHAEELVSSARSLGGQLSGNLVIGCYEGLPLVQCAVREDVPEMVLVAESPEFQAEVMDEPGANRSSTEP